MSLLGLALGLLLQDPDSYDGLVAQGLALGRAGRHAEAASAFDRALALDPARSEAWTERGGLRFLETRYAEAVSDLRRALALREDPYTRDLLASALHLDGQDDEALAHWNVLGQPVLRTVRMTGLRHTRDQVARRELPLVPGETLRLDKLRTGQRRLRETGVFARINLRPLPDGRGAADLEVALLERHGFASGFSDLALRGALDALHDRVRIGYANLGGQGVGLGASYRWERNRPEATVSLTWPRPLGLPFYLRAQGFRGRQAYALEGQRLRERSRRVEIALRSVLGAGTVAQLGLRAVEGTGFVRGQARPLVKAVGVEAALERTLVETARQQAVTSFRLFASTPVSGYRSYARGVFEARYGLALSPKEGTLEASHLAARVHVGQVAPSAPLLDWFAVGGSPDMDLPLRGRTQAPTGVLGGATLGRSLVLLNLEWRRRLLRRGPFESGIVFFYDGARLGGRAAGPPRRFHDLGGGLRLATRAGTLMRLDYGRGLTDGEDSFSFGLGHAF